MTESVFQKTVKYVHYCRKGNWRIRFHSISGAPANPIVKKGDHVLKGQKIAEAGGFVSSPIHASVSGTVKGIEYRFNPAGTKQNVSS